MRYEKTGRTNESFVEILLDGPRVRFAKGSRKKGTDDWTMRDSDVRTHLFDGDVAKATAFYEEKIKALLDDKFVPVGESMPVLAAERGRRMANEAQNAASRLITALGEKRDLAATVAEAEQRLEQWDTGLAAMSEASRESFRKLYGASLERLRAALASAR